MFLLFSISNDRSLISFCLVYVCTREFYFIAPNLLFKQENDLKIYEIVFFLKLVRVSVAGRMKAERKEEDYNR